MSSRRKKIFLGTALALLSLGFGSPVYARDYLVNYGYKTPPQGEIDVELWMDYTIKDRDDSGSAVFQGQTEVEYGITDRWTLGVYGVWERKRHEIMTYKMTKLETRFRFFEKGEKFLDPAIYLEYKKLDRDENDDILEAKLILSKDIGNFNLVTNLKFFEKIIDSDGDIEFGYTLGTNYRVTKKVKLGLELKGELGGEGDFGLDSNKKHYLIPGIYADLAKDVELAFGLGFGLTGESDDFLIKTILEFEF